MPFRRQSLATCFADNGIRLSQTVRQKTVIVTKVRNPTIAYVRKRELEIAGHTETTPRVYVCYAAIRKAPYNLLRVVLAKVITNQYLQIVVLLAHDRLQTVVKSVRSFPRRHYYCELSLIMHVARPKA
jgi:hypothetical protein